MEVGLMRKVIVFVLLGLLFITGFWGCATVEKSSGGVAKLNVKASKYPEIIDHKNMKWGKDAPEWVVKEREEIEKSG